jgi:hypothetical protein
MSQGQPDGPSVLTGDVNGVGTLQSFWFIKSDQLGKVSIGKQSQASDNTAILVDGSGSLVPANWVSFDVNNFFIRNSNTGNLTTLNWGGAGGCVWGDCNGLPTNSVRYDSPTFGGFSVSASWGEDDFWDVAARYAGEWNSVKVSVAAAYSQTNSTANDSPNVAQPIDSGYFQIGAYVEHIPTGLFAYGAYGHLDLFDTNATVVPRQDADANDTFYIKGGIRQRWNPLGHTVLYGEFLRAENNSAAFSDTGVDICPGAPGFVSCNQSFAGRSNVKVWGLGVVQEIDAAAMSIWLKYRHLDADVNGDFTNNVSVGPFDFSTPAGSGSIDTDSFDEVTFGALINF